MKILIQKAFLTIVSLVFFSLAVNAQKFVYELPIVSGNIQLDGFLEEDVWQKLNPVHTVQIGAYDRDSLLNQSSFYLFIEKNELIIGGKLHAPFIESSIVQHDIVQSDQTVEILLQDIRNQDYSYGFRVNSEGVASTKLYYERQKLKGIGESNQYNSSWNKSWDVEVMSNDSIWSLEARIPLVTMPFTKLTPANLTVAIMVKEPLDYEISRWPYSSDENSTRNHYPNYSNRQVHLKPSNSRNMEFSGSVHSVLGASWENSDRSWLVTGGGEIHFTPNSKNQLSLSVLPDFTDVEDLSLVNNIQTLRSYRKPKTDIELWNEPLFDYKWNKNNQLFYRAEEALYVPTFLQGMYAYNGKNWQVGTKNIWDSTGVLQLNRYKYFLNNRSSIGLINLNSFAKENNSLFGLDYLYRKESRYFFDAKWTVFIDEKMKASELLDYSRYHFSFFNQKKVGFDYYIGIDHVGSKYYSEHSFEDLLDYNSVATQLGYGWKSDEESRVYRQRVGMRSEMYLKNYTNLLDLFLFEMDFTMDFKSGSYLGLQYSYLIDRLFETFSFRPEVYTYKGVYAQNRMKISLGNSSLSKFHFGLSGEFGEFFDGEFVQLEQNVRYRLNRRISLYLDYTYLMNIVAGYPALPLVHTHLIHAKIAYQLSEKILLLTQIQSLNARTLSTSFVNLRWNITDALQINVIYRGKNQLQKIISKPLPDHAMNQQTMALKLKYHF